MATKRFITVIHVLLNLLQVAISVVFIRLDLLILAVPAALAGKWRMASFNPYRLWRNIRANSCDVIVVVSTVLLMNFYQARLGVLLGLATFLAAWLIIIKPATTSGWVALQAALCHFLGLSALWLVGLERGWHGLILLPLVGLIAYSGARHAGLPLGEGEDQRERSVIPIIWAVLMVQLGWLSWIWSITYILPGDILIPQLALIGTGLGYFAVNHMYVYADSRRRLPLGYLWQQILFCLLVIAAVVVLTPWSAS